MYILKTNNTHQYHNQNQQHLIKQKPIGERKEYIGRGIYQHYLNYETSRLEQWALNHKMQVRAWEHQFEEDRYQKQLTKHNWIVLNNSYI